METTTFIWDDELACEWSGYVNKRLSVPGKHSLTDILKDFKELKQPKRNWQILSFRVKDDPSINYRQGAFDDFLSPDGIEYSLESMLYARYMSVKSGQMAIESVKRLSDGEVFTLGDDYLFQDCLATIDEFRIDHCSRMVVEVQGLYLDAIQKPRKPLFTSYDKVEIYEGMEYWYVLPCFSIIHEKSALPMGGMRLDIRYFSTEAAAIAYIHENKPIYSIKDFREIIRAFEERIAPKTPE